MGFRVPEDVYAEWQRRGLVPTEPVRRDEPHPAPKAKGKPKLLAASYTPPGTWLVPVRLDSHLNGGRALAGLIGGKQRHWNAVRAVIPKWAREYADFIDHMTDGGRLRLTLTRIGPGKPDRINVPEMCKYMADATAFLLGVDDDDPRLDWQFDREKAAGYGCRVTMEML